MISLELPASSEALRLVGPWLRSVLFHIGNGAPSTTADQLELALQEVCVNVVEHAYASRDDGRIRLDYEFRDRHWITVTDTGIPFDPTSRPQVDFDHPTEGGYGLHLIDALCETLDYERCDGENRWTISHS
jgi:anti-sigma regulatory factor (Ser/Thr protein kinase)